MASNKEKLIAGAQKLVEKGSFDKAIKEYLKVVQEDELDVRVWLKIGDLYAKLSRRAEATETYQRVAQFYSDQGFYLKAVAVYKQILQIDPRLVDVNIRLAELYKQLGLVTDAVQQFEAAAVFYQREGRGREALAVIKQVVELDHQTVANRIKLAEFYSKEQMPLEAAEEFSKAAAQLKEAGRIDDFMKVAERLLFHSPDNQAINKELARLYIEKGEPRRALPKLQVLFKADPREVEVLGLLASAFESLDQRPKAVSVLKEQARILGENGDEKERAEVARKVLALVPGDPDAEAILGRARAHSTVSRRAVSSADARLSSSVSRRLAPTPLPVSQEFDDSAPTHGARGARRTLHSAHGELREADATAAARVEEAIAKILNEADVYAKYNLHAKAIEHLQRVFERNPRHQAAREKLKTLYLLSGKRDEAVLELWALAESAEPDRQRRYLREILEIDPQNVRAAEQLGERPSGVVELDPRAPAPQEIGSAEILIDEPSDPVWEGEGRGFGPEDASDDTATSISRSAYEEPTEEPRGGSAVADEGPQVIATDEAEMPLGVDVVAVDLDDELDEADFFMQQNLFEEARALLEGLRARHSEHAGVEAKLGELESLEASAIVMASDDSLTPIPEPLTGWADSRDLDATHRGVVERGVSAEDLETHYDLGIAYKEMGLINDAISEFQLVMKDRTREVQCHLMVGLCYLQKDALGEAIAQFKKGLYVEGISDRESMTLYFELGQANEKLGEVREALYYYDKVYERDPRFRDVERRLSVLRGEHPAATVGGVRSGEDVDSEVVDSLLREDG